MNKDELKPCPFCGGDAETKPNYSKPTLEEAMTAEPNARCTTSGCLARFVECSVSEWNTRDNSVIESAEHPLKELLCIIHRDGGHYISQHGLEKASKDAEKIVVDLLHNQDGVVEEKDAVIKDLTERLNNQTDKVKHFAHKYQKAEKETEEKLLSMLNWMDEINRANPMQLETDNEDIVAMFLEEKEVNDESIDEVLRQLIKESDLQEVVCCLDMITEEDTQHIKLFDTDGKQIYPVI